jgi:hypothetical protein
LSWLDNRSVTMHRFLVARRVGAEPFSYKRTCLVLQP